MHWCLAVPVFHDPQVGQVHMDYDVTIVLQEFARLLTAVFSGKSITRGSTRKSCAGSVMSMHADPVNVQGEKPKFQAISRFPCSWNLFFKPFQKPGSIRRLPNR